jgi:integrase/recombinase XerD
MQSAETVLDVLRERGRRGLPLDELYRQLFNPRLYLLRHTAAMTLLGAGIDTSTIALWLGHEQERTTHVYLHADLALKQRTLDRITPPGGHPGRYRAPDTLLAFLEGL